MKKIIIIIFVVYTFVPCCYAKRMYKEEVYQEYWCNMYKGIKEFQLNDNTRVDCLTKEYAVEVDFANKWAECIGQSLYYGIKTNKCPACLLIMEKEKDFKYLQRLRYVADKHGVKTFTITPDKIKSFACQK